MSNLLKKTVLITGASRGIGAAIAERLACPDLNIVVNYNLNKSRADEVVEKCTKKGANAVAIKADVSSIDEVTAMFQRIDERFGGVDILINNAGISVYGMIQDITIDDWTKVYGVNVNGMFFCSKQAISNMISKKWGRVINISSMWGLVGASCETLYSSTKGAIIAFTKALAKEVSYSGITVNSIAPGVVDTEMIHQLSDETLEAVKEEIPMGRFLSADEIAIWVEHLISPSADGVTGQIISPNGGLVIV